jgi:recombinational DNA repair protein (RecF pathway)
MSDKIKCQSCGAQVGEDDVYTTDGKTLCEDCYIDQSHRIRVCDPWAERSKRVYRERLGLEGTDGLTDLQKEIYEYIRSKGRATQMELVEQFKLLPAELENEFAILRHCQLLKGRKEGDLVYIVPW